MAQVLQYAVAAVSALLAVLFLAARYYLSTSNRGGTLAEIRSRPHREVDGRGIRRSS
jgi:hypothetical protein